MEDIKSCLQMFSNDIKCQLEKIQNELINLKKEVAILKEGGDSQIPKNELKHEKFDMSDDEIFKYLNNGTLIKDIKLLSKIYLESYPPIRKYNNRIIKYWKDEKWNLDLYGKEMKIILREDVPNLGSSGTIIHVKRGFARNYLIPRNFAIPATPNNLKVFEHEKRIIEAKRGKQRKEAEALKSKLERVSCSISKKVGEQDKLYGSVTAIDIEAAFQSEGFTIDKKDIVLNEQGKQRSAFVVGGPFAEVLVGKL